MRIYRYLPALLLGIAPVQAARERLREFVVPFAVAPVTTPSENGACRLTPSFALLEKAPEIVQSFFPAPEASGAEVVTIASSSSDKFERSVSVDVPEFWQVSTGPASCESKCVRLPRGTVLTGLTLSYSDGAESCLIKPLDNRVTPTVVGIVCNDSAWPEVLVQPGERPVVCATATNFSRLRRPTQHRLVLRYRDRQ